MENIFELYEFFVEGNNTRQSHVLLHISEPTADTREKGYFFCVCEVLNGQPEYIQKIQSMINDIESGYYETDDAGQKNAFEITLEFINRRAHHLLAPKGSQLNCFVGVIAGDQLLFSSHGKPYAHVVYQKNELWKHIELISEEEHQEQLFAAVTQGKIATGDSLCVSTSSFATHFDDDRLSKMLEQFGPKEMAGHIEKTLHSLQSPESFGGIVVYRPRTHEIPKTGRIPRGSKRGSEKSLDGMIQTRQDTRETLSPSLFSSVAKGMASAVRRTDFRTPSPQKKAEETNYRPRQLRQKETEPKQSFLVLFGKALVMGFTGLWLLSKGIGVALGNFFLGVFLFITNHGRQRELIREQYIRWIHKQKDSIARMPTLSKLLFLGAVILAVLFISSIALIKVKEGHDLAKQEHDQLILAIRDKKDAAEASLIYGDEQKAMSLIQEAQTLLNELSEQNIKGTNDTLNALSHNITQIQIQLQKLTIINQTMIADIALARDGVSVSQMEKIDGSLVLFGQDDPYAYVYNLATQQITSVDHSAVSQLHSASTPKEEDRTVLMTTDGRLALYSPKNKTISSSEISFPIDDVSISDLVIYNTRLYTLDSATGQIYKHNPTQTGYDRGSAWLTADANLAGGGVSIAIDGDIFVLTDTGVLKFVKGVPQPFVVQGLDPALENPTIIWTYNDVDRIYILEPTHKRVIVLAKDGKMISQYSTDIWKGPTGMYIDVVQNTAYVLDSNKIYSFQMK